MPSRGEAAAHVVRKRRPAKHLVLEAGAILGRGLRETAPRRVDYPKLASTVVRQLVFKSPRDYSGATVLMPFTGHDAERTLRLLGDVPDLTLGAPVFPGFLDQLAAEGGSRVVAVLGDGETPRADSHATFARSLVAHSPLIEQRTAQQLVERFRAVNGIGSFFPAAFDRDPLVIEERPGKAIALQLEDQALKVHLKKWQQLAQRQPGEPVKAAFETPDGFGFGAFVLGGCDAETRTGRSVQFASLDVTLAEESVGLDTGPAIRNLAAGWFEQETGRSLDAVKRIVLSVPWLAVAVHIGQAFKGPDVVFPDQVFGWQPFLSALYTLYQAELPALFIYTGRFPEVHVAAVWS
jgi:hypothetical protein